MYLVEKNNEVTPGSWRFFTIKFCSHTLKWIEKKEESLHVCGEITINNRRNVSEVQWEKIRDKLGQAPVVKTTRVGGKQKEENDEKKKEEEACAAYPSY